MQPARPPTPRNYIFNSIQDPQDQAMAILKELDQSCKAASVELKKAQITNKGEFNITVMEELMIVLKAASVMWPRDVTGSLNAHRVNFLTCGVRLLKTMMGMVTTSKDVAGLLSVRQLNEMRDFSSSAESAVEGSVRSDQWACKCSKCTNKRIEIWRNTKESKKKLTGASTGGSATWLSTPTPMAL